MKFADLHLHTIFSDGTNSPEELVIRAEKAGLSAIAVVDHDTVRGIEAASSAGKQANIEVLPGIELSAEFEGLEIHILGYLIDYRNKNLLEKLDSLKENRIARVYKIIEKLKNLGVNLNPETVLALGQKGTVGRLHIARIMVREGLVGSIYEAFQKYIGDKSPAYVLNFKLSPQQAIELIKGAAGIPVLAHPYILKRDDLIPQFVDYGLKGLEVYYPEHTQSKITTYLGLAKKYALLVTGGSDFHGEVKPDVKIGDTRIPYGLVEKLKEAKKL
jgi:predicted metal-dependent phosphoesterase TrpH